MKISRTTDYALIRDLNAATVIVEMQPETYDDSDWWVVRDCKNEAVAYAGLYTAIKDQGWLVRAGVLRHARGGGLQKRLIRVREARARKLGIPVLFTYTADWNKASMASLAQCGFVPYSTSEHYIYWSKKL